MFNTARSTLDFEAYAGENGKLKLKR